MSETVDIGAARVRLIVDANDFDPIIEQGKRAVRGFGDEAQKAYDRTEKGTRRAADALLDYVTSLGRADTTMDRYIRNASRMGVEKPVLDAAIGAWQKHNDEVEVANTLIADQASHVARVQGVWKQFQAEQAGFDRETSRRQAAEDAGRQRALDDMERFREEARRANAELANNSAFGIKGPDAARSQRQADLDATFAPIIERENAELAKQKQLLDLIDQGRKQHAAEQGDFAAAEAQKRYNVLLGVETTKRKELVQLEQQYAEAQREAMQKQANGEAYIKQLQNIEASAGKSYYELLRLKAAELGVADAAAPFIARIQKGNEEMGRGTISAKQYSLAIRQLPAQFTDVFVSLAAGQNPLLVLLQQGGQVKDMFGGIKTAVAAVAKESLGLLANPWVLLAAAIGTVAVAAYAADSRITSLAISTAKGNGIAGSARELSAFAEQLNSLKNINLSSADAAVNKLAESGKLSGENFRLAAEASARWAAVTGESVDDVASKFDSIAKDPMAAILDGTVKITEAQYNQIRALTEAGDNQKAVNELIRIYYDQINKNTETVVSNLSNIAKAWRDIKDAATTAAHAAVSAVDATLGALQRFAKWREERRKDMFPDMAAGMQPAAAVAAAPAAVAAAPVVAAGKTTLTLTQNQIKANEDLAKAWDNSGTHAEMLKAKVDKLNATLRNATDSALAERGVMRGPNGTFSGDGYKRLVKALDDRTRQEKKVPQGSDPTKAIQERERTALQALRATQQEFDYLYADRESTVEAYYSKSLFLAREEADVQIKSNNEQIKALTGRRDSEDKIAALRQQNRTVEEQFAIKKAKLDRDEVLATRDRTAAMRDYLTALSDANSQLQRSFQQQTRAVGMGGRNSDRLNALDNAQADFVRNSREVQNQQDDKRISPEEAARKQQALYDALIEKQRLIAQGYMDIQSAESNWQNGSIKAWEEWRDTVGNVAQQVGAITTKALDGLATSIVDKIATGKSGFKDYLDTLNRMILDFIVKQQLSKFFTSIGNSAQGTDYAAIASQFFTALFSGTASAKGNVFGGGQLAAYRNTIVSQPTYFAKGGVPNINIMGERSGKPHEAVMPLTRTSGGDLGVKVTGGVARNTTINQTFVVPGAVDRNTRDQVAIKVFGAASRASRRS